jgi:peroxiredoxin
MRGRNRVSALLFASALTLLVAADARDSRTVIGRRVPHFVLPDCVGKAVGLADFKDSKYLVIAFLGTECPVSNAYVPILRDLQEQYRAKRVQVIGINANAGDSTDAITKHARKYDISFPVLVDARQSTLPLFGARRTPEVFVLDTRSVIRYRGRIDDQITPTYRRDEPRRRDLREALEDLLAGRKVRVDATEAAGCLITPMAGRTKKGAITYARQVAPILQKHCIVCHHSGTAAPFELLTYTDAANWAAMIGEVVAQRRMPPWHADPRYGHFANERGLTPDEIATVTAWVAAGAPQGDARATPPPPALAEGWRIGEPDAVVSMPTVFSVPAKGKIPYQFFVTKTNLKEDVWVQSAEVRPGNQAVVHHIIVFYRDTKPGASQELVWIASYVPGGEPVVLSTGQGRRIPAGADLVWQMHYTATGKKEKDRSELGLVFCKEPPKHNVMTYGISNVFLKIPPGAAHQRVVSSVPVTRPAVLLSLFPHMHMRGKDFEFRVLFPDGRQEVLLSVPQYDFNWQHTYRLQEPLHLPQGAVIQCVAHFDNSAANPANPNPNKEVRWGDQAWNEMMTGYIDYYWEK